MPLLSLLAVLTAIRWQDATVLAADVLKAAMLIGVLNSCCLLILSCTYLALVEWVQTLPHTHTGGKQWCH